MGPIAGTADGNPGPARVGDAAPSLYHGPVICTQSTDSTSQFPREYAADRRLASLVAAWSAVP